MNESAQLRRLLAGYQVSEALNVAVQLRLPDLLAEGPRHVDDLAVASSSHPATLYRLMRALAAAGVFEELADRRFASNGLSDLLRADVENSLRPWAENVNQPDHRQAWAGLLDSVVTGRNAYSTVHGTDVWTYRNAHPAQGALFDAAMTALSRQVAGAVTSATPSTNMDSSPQVSGSIGILPPIFSASSAFHAPTRSAGTPGFRALSRSSVKLGVLEAREVRPGAPDLGRREQRVEVRLEAHHDVEDSLR